MSLSVILFSMAALAAQPRGEGTAQTEMLGIDAPDEFEVGYRAREDDIEIIEMIQPPETVDTWSKLITLFMLYNSAESGGLDSFYGRWRDKMLSSCAGATDTVVRGFVDELPALKMSLSCPKNPETGKPEIFAAVLVQGQANLMMVQVAFRHSITLADSALIEHIVGSLKVCDQRTLSVCSARKATGFIAADN